MLSLLRQAIKDYLALRRSLGSKLLVYDRLLSDFVTHLERRGHSVITAATAVEWAQQRAEISVNTRPGVECREGSLSMSARWSREPRSLRRNSCPSTAASSPRLYTQG